MFEHFTPTHIPPLLLATSLSLGGMIPLVYPSYAIRAMGLPERIARVPEAQTMMTIGMARTTTLGLALWTFYLQGKLEEVDTLLMLLGTYIGVVDAWVCVREGVVGKAWMRGLSGLAAAISKNGKS